MIISKIINSSWLERTKRIRCDPTAIQQIEFVWKLKKTKNEIVANESMLFLTILENIKETRLTFSQGSITVL